ncbi:MAG: ArnT family glycosyltransferase [Myxococcota bacterium]
MRIDLTVLKRRLLQVMLPLTLTLLFLGHTFLLVWWLNAHVLPNGYQNEIFHLGNALDLYNAFVAADGRLIHDLLFTQYWPPLHYLASFPFLWVEISRDSFVLSNLFFLAILVFTTYQLGKSLENRAVGLLAAFLVTFFPSIYGNLRHFEPNVPLTAGVTASLWLLYQSHRFAHRTRSILFGLVVGLTMMVDRISGAFFVVLPALVELISTLRRESSWRSPRFRASVINACFSVLAALLVCGYFYAHFFRLYSEEILPQAVQGEILSTGEQSEFRPPLAWSTLLFYPNSLLDSQVGFGLGLLLLPALLWCVKSGGRLRLLWSWLLLPILLFTIIQKKQLYYTIPVLPAFALLVAVGLLRVRARVRAVWVSVVLLVALHQLLVTSLDLRLLPDRFLLPLSQPRLVELSMLGGRSLFPEPWVAPRYPQSYPPNTDNLRVPEILAAVSAERGQLPGFRVETFSEDTFFFEGYLTFFIRTRHPDAIVNGLIQNPQGFYENLRLLDVFVYVTPGPRAFPSAESIQAIVQSRGQMRDFEGLPITSVLQVQASRLRLKSRLELGNGATAYVYGLKGWQELGAGPAGPAAPAAAPAAPEAGPAAPEAAPAAPEAAPAAPEAAGAPSGGESPSAAPRGEKTPSPQVP